MTIAVGAALLAMTIPTLATLLVFAIREPGQRFIYNRVTGPQLAFGIVVTFAVLGLLALWLGLLVARREAERLGAPLTELSTMAERLREGTGTLEPLTTGIVEVDRISQGLTRRLKELGERYETPMPRLAVVSGCR